MTRDIDLVVELAADDADRFCALSRASSISTGASFTPPPTGARST
jgi:hypothetical protein